MATVMKKYMFLAATFLAVCTFTACMDDVPEPPVTDDNGITSQESVGEVNTTIAQLKTRFKNSITARNSFEEVEEDLIFEGTVVANDVSGNLYQTLVLRDIRDDGSDQCIQLGIKHTHLSPFFPVGQTLRVNLKGLWIGNYSYVPKIGQPYFTSAGNKRLGPMLFQLCRTQVQIVDGPSAVKKKALVTPLKKDEAWLATKSNQNINNAPLLVTLEGYFPEADGQRVFTPNISQEEDPEEGYDAGYAKDRTFKVGNTDITVRTSTRNEISYTTIPLGRCRVTGVLTYYSGWQLQLRELADLESLE